jgi:hypothetical protein
MPWLCRLRCARNPVMNCWIQKEFRQCEGARCANDQRGGICFKDCSLRRAGLAEPFRATTANARTVQLQVWNASSGVPSEWVIAASRRRRSLMRPFRNKLLRRFQASRRPDGSSLRDRFRGPSAVATRSPRPDRPDTWPRLATGLDRLGIQLYRLRRYNDALAAPPRGR